MTFKHKLSVRLALMRDAAVVAALVATACERPVAVTTPGGDPVTQLVVFPQTLTLQPTQTAQLMAVAFTAAGDTGNVSVSWSVTGGSITDASTTGGRHYGRYQAGTQVGTFTAVALGNPGAVADTAVVSVTAVPVAAVDLTPTSATIEENQTLQLTATPRDAHGQPLSGRVITWASENAGVATVSASGLVTAKTAGSATITATSEGQTGLAAITVTLAPVAAVSVTPGVASVQEGSALQLTATPRDAMSLPLSNRVVTWASSSDAVATVDGTGRVTGATVGSATITATSEGKSGSAAISVITVPLGQCGPWPGGITAWVQPLPPSTGQAFYAAPTGSDANPGTLAAPWLSLSKANALQPGQILYLRAGTYGARGTTALDFKARGTATAPITLAGYPGEARPVLQGQLYMSGEYLRLTGVVIDGPTGNVGGPGPGGEAITLIMRGSHLELSNSEARFDWWHAGVGAGGAFDYRIINNYIHDNGGYNGDYTDDQWNTSHGVYNSPSSYGLIANNVIEHNDAKGLMGRHDAHHILVVNNTVVGNGRYGIDIAESTHDWVLANNILLNNGTIKGGSGIGTPGSGGASYVQINNLFWNNGTGGNSTWSNNATIINNRVANPLLVNPAVATDRQHLSPNTDNRLQAGSPAIGFADPNYALPYDITGKCRDGAPDAGAHER